MSQPSATAAKPTADRAVVLSHSSITFFPSWKHDRSGEGSESRPRPLRVHRSEAQSLDSTPALRTLPVERMGIITPKPLLFPLALSPPSSFTHPLSSPRWRLPLGNGPGTFGRLPTPTSLF